MDRSETKDIDFHCKFQKFYNEGVCNVLGEFIMKGDDVFCDGFDDLFWINSRIH